MKMEFNNYSYKSMTYIHGVGFMRRLGSVFTYLLIQVRQ